MKSTSLWLFMAMAWSAPARIWSCGYMSCPKTKDGFLNVHLVPHTHDDVGWLKTVDQYFYGSKKDITPVGVQYILDSVIPELIRDPSKRFIYVEMAFFFRWWDEQHDIVRHQVRKLVQNGQLEFILGGWSMNDEAATHYNAIIDQMSWGLKKLNDTFGECVRPRVAWQIDPFGHSREQANLFAQMGFDGLFFGRLDYDDKKRRMKERTMEMIWKGSDSLGKSSWLFTGALFNGYGPPDGFCFDVFCDDEPIMDDPRMHDYNADKKVEDFLNAVKEQAKAYSSNHIMMTMGSDFNYVQAQSWYKNLDKLIRLVNQRQEKGSKVNLLYSTPSCYLKALNDNGATYGTKSDDFFPYASDPHAYWTGYFTSRPSLKGMIRSGNNFLQICKQMDALSTRDWVPALEGDVTVMREAMGVLQHHDAVTGTAKQAVTFDYAQRLAEGFSECQQVVSSAYKLLMPKSSESKGPVLKFCPLLNITQCETTETSETFVVHAYNPLGRKVSKYVRLPVTYEGYKVVDSDGAEVKAQIVPMPRQFLGIPGRSSKAEHELVFKVELPPLGWRSYHVTQSQDKIQLQKSFKVTVAGKPTNLGNDQLDLRLGSTGNIEKVSLGDETYRFSQKFAFYEGHMGNNTEFELRASGAYIFRPRKQTPNVLALKRKPVLVKGPLVQELHQDFGSMASQVVRVYKDSDNAEFQWLVGPISVEDGVGKEVITRYDTEIKSAGTFFTDSNGRQLLKRVLNYRPTWKLNVTEPVSGNYYPVNSRIIIKPEAKSKTDLQLAVLTDRSQGGTSLQDGQVELMLHRRLLFDDNFGVGEALNETAFGQGLVTIGRHWIQLTTNENSDQVARKHRFKAQEAFMDVSLSFTKTDLNFEEWRSKYKMEGTFLQESALPDNVHLLTVESWLGNSRDSVLIRLEHIFEANEDSQYSKTAQVDLSRLFANYKIVSVEEVVLDGNLPIKKSTRLEWNVMGDNDLQSSDEGSFTPQQNTITVSDKVIKLEPMQIRTFILDLE